MTYLLFSASLKEVIACRGLANAAGVLLRAVSFANDSLGLLSNTPRSLPSSPPSPPLDKPLSLIYINSARTSPSGPTGDSYRLTTSLLSMHIATVVAPTVLILFNGAQSSGKSVRGVKAENARHVSPRRRRSRRDARPVQYHEPEYVGYEVETPDNSPSTDPNSSMCQIDDWFPNIRVDGFYTLDIRRVFKRVKHSVKKMARRTWRKLTSGTSPSRDIIQAPELIDDKKYLDFSDLSEPGSVLGELERHGVNVFTGLVLVAFSVQFAAAIMGISMVRDHYVGVERYLSQEDTIVESISPSSGGSEDILAGRTEDEKEASNWRDEMRVQDEDRSGWDLLQYKQLQHLQEDDEDDIELLYCTDGKNEEYQPYDIESLYDGDREDEEFQPYDIESLYGSDRENAEHQQDDNEREHEHDQSKNNTTITIIHDSTPDKLHETDTNIAENEDNSGFYSLGSSSSRDSISTLVDYEETEKQGDKEKKDPLDEVRQIHASMRPDTNITVMPALCRGAPAPSFNLCQWLDGVKEMAEQNKKVGGGGGAGSADNGKGKEKEKETTCVAGMNTVWKGSRIFPTSRSSVGVLVQQTPRSQPAASANAKDSKPVLPEADDVFGSKPSLQVSQPSGLTPSQDYKLNRPRPASARHRILRAFSGLKYVDSRSGKQKDLDNSDANVTTFGHPMTKRNGQEAMEAGPTKEKGIPREVRRLDHHKLQNTNLDKEPHQPSDDPLEPSRSADDKPSCCFLPTANSSHQDLRPGSPNKFFKFDFTKKCKFSKEDASATKKERTLQTAWKARRSKVAAKIAAGVKKLKAKAKCGGIEEMDEIPIMEGWNEGRSEGVQAFERRVEKVLPHLVVDANAKNGPSPRKVDNGSKGGRSNSLPEGEKTPMVTESTERGVEMKRRPKTGMNDKPASLSLPTPPPPTRKIKAKATTTQAKVPISPPPVNVPASTRYRKPDSTSFVDELFDNSSLTRLLLEKRPKQHLHTSTQSTRPNSPSQYLDRARAAFAASTKDDDEHPKVKSKSQVSSLPFFTADAIATRSYPKRIEYILQELNLEEDVEVEAFAPKKHFKVDRRDYRKIAVTNAFYKRLEDLELQESLDREREAEAKMVRRTKPKSPERKSKTSSKIDPRMMLEEVSKIIEQAAEGLSLEQAKNNVEIEIEVKEVEPTMENQLIPVIKTTKGKDWSTSRVATENIDTVYTAWEHVKEETKIGLKSWNKALHQVTAELVTHPSEPGGKLRQKASVEHKMEDRIKTTETSKAEHLEFQGAIEPTIMEKVNEESEKLWPINLEETSQDLPLSANSSVSEVDTLFDNWSLMKLLQETRNRISTPRTPPATPASSSRSLVSSHILSPVRQSPDQAASQPSPVRLTPRSPPPSRIPVVTGPRLKSPSAQGSSSFTHPASRPSTPIRIPTPIGPLASRTCLTKTCDSTPSRTKLIGYKASTIASRGRQSPAIPKTEKINASGSQKSTLSSVSSSSRSRSSTPARLPTHVSIPKVPSLSSPAPSHPSVEVKTPQSKSSRVPTPTRTPAPAPTSDQIPTPKLQRTPPQAPVLTQLDTNRPAHYIPRYPPPPPPVQKVPESASQGKSTTKGPERRCRLAIPGIEVTSPELRRTRSGLRLAPERENAPVEKFTLPQISLRRVQLSPKKEGLAKADKNIFGVALKPIGSRSNIPSSAGGSSSAKDKENIGVASVYLRNLKTETDVKLQNSAMSAPRVATGTLVAAVWKDRERPTQSFSSAVSAKGEVKTGLWSRNMKRV